MQEPVDLVPRQGMKALSKSTIQGMRRTNYPVPATQLIR